MKKIRVNSPCRPLTQAEKAAEQVRIFNQREDMLCRLSTEDPRQTQSQGGKLRSFNLLWHEGRMSVNDLEANVTERAQSINQPRPNTLIQEPSPKLPESLVTQDDVLPCPSKAHTLKEESVSNTNKGSILQEELLPMPTQSNTLQEEPLPQQTQSDALQKKPSISPVKNNAIPECISPDPPYSNVIPECISPDPQYSNTIPECISPDPQHSNAIQECVSPDPSYRIPYQEQTSPNKSQNNAVKDELALQLSNSNLPEQEDAMSVLLAGAKDKTEKLPDIAVNEDDPFACFSDQHLRSLSNHLDLPSRLNGLAFIWQLAFLSCDVTPKSFSYRVACVLYNCQVDVSAISLFSVFFYPQAIETSSEGSRVLDITLFFKLKNDKKLNLAKTLEALNRMQPAKMPSLFALPRKVCLTTLDARDLFEESNDAFVSEAFALDVGFKLRRQRGHSVPTKFAS